MKKVITKSDIIFTVVLAAAVLLIWFITLPRTTGDRVVFKRDGVELASLSLQEDARYEVEGLYHNVFEIKNGEVRVIHTDCPNHQCERTGRISRVGQSIVCAPNSTSATITGEDVDIDGIAG